MNQRNAVSITFTGADERTSIAELQDLALHPAVEIGLLFTVSPDGRNRYPSTDWLKAATAALHGVYAIHVCGGRAKALLAAGELSWLVEGAGRIQVNGRSNDQDLSPAWVESICLAHPDKIIITQHCEGNDGLLGVRAINHEVLVDGSGGRGLSPASWIRPVTGKPVGYAGGIGPENITETLNTIEQLCNPRPWWIDFEGKLRTDDWFDVTLARKSLSLFESWLIV